MAPGYDHREEKNWNTGANRYSNYIFKKPSGLLFGNDAASTEIAGLVVAFVFGDLHAPDACVDEFEFAGSIVSGYHNSDMADRSPAAAACEEHKVALAEIALGYLDTFRGLHTRRRTDFVAELAVNIA